MGNLVLLHSTILLLAINHANLLFDWQLSTKVRTPTQFHGEKCFIEPQYLEPHRSCPGLVRQLAAAYPVVIMLCDSSKPPHHISFFFERKLVDLINDSLPDSNILQMSFVRPFILSTKVDKRSNDNKM